MSRAIHNQRYLRTICLMKSTHLRTRLTTRAPERDGLSERTYLNTTGTIAWTTGVNQWPVTLGANIVRWGYSIYRDDSSLSRTEQVRKYYVGIWLHAESKLVPFKANIIRIGYRVDDSERRSRDAKKPQRLL